MSPSDSELVRPAPAAPPRIGMLGTIALVAIVAGFAFVRFAALQNDLWMDEIWSVQAVQDLKSAGEIFTRYLQANNHPLSSLWLYAIAPARVEWWYRLLSWTCGVASIVLGARLAIRQLRIARPDATAADLRVAGLSAAWLFGSCYFLIVYSSEARGYAPALAFSLLAFHLLVRNPDGNRAIVRVPAYWAACALALLSHAAAVQVIGAGVLWSLVHAIRARTPLPATVRTLVSWHLVPLGTTAAFFLFFLRRMSVGGAPEPAVRQTLGELVAYTFGLPNPEIGWFALPLLILAAAVALWRLGRRSPEDATFHAVVIFSAPVLALLAARMAVLFPRYFIFGSAWSLLLVAYGAAVAWRRGGWMRPAAIAGLVLFGAGNFAHTRVLLRHGRGEYRAALRYIAEHTSTSDISLCSDHDNRNYMLIAYYVQRTIPGRRLLYFPGNGSAQGRPQWLLVHRLDGVPKPTSPLYDDRGNAYQFEKAFLHAPLAGWDWFVYRNTLAVP